MCIYINISQCALGSHQCSRLGSNIAIGLFFKWNPMIKPFGAARCVKERLKKRCSQKNRRKVLELSGPMSIHGTTHHTQGSLRCTNRKSISRIRNCTHWHIGWWYDNFIRIHMSQCMKSIYTQDIHRITRVEVQWKFLCESNNRGLNDTT